jgi:hypothetical protein
MNAQDQLRKIAKALFWWKSPEEALANPRRFLAQVMMLGTWQEVQKALAIMGLASFEDALAHAPPGVFDRRTWAYWHAVFGIPERPIPVRKIPGCENLVHKDWPGDY